MKLYMVEFDNGEKYSDNENYVCAIFDSYEKAEQYCLSKPHYKESEKIKGLFNLMGDFKYKHVLCETLEIVEVELNQEFRRVE